MLPDRKSQNPLGQSLPPMWESQAVIMPGRALREQGIHALLRASNACRRRAPHVRLHRNSLSCSTAALCMALRALATAHDSCAYHTDKQMIYGNWFTWFR